MKTNHIIMYYQILEIKQSIIISACNVINNNTEYKTFLKNYVKQRDDFNAANIMGLVQKISNEYIHKMGSIKYTIYHKMLGGNSKWLSFNFYIKTKSVGNTKSQTTRMKMVYMDVDTDIGFFF